MIKSLSQHLLLAGALLSGPFNASLGATIHTSQEAQTPTGSCVILLHGLARSERSMRPLEEALAHEGFDVVNLGYHSVEAPIETLAETAITQALSACKHPSTRTHFVTHSLGGILVRQYFQAHPHQTLGRVVMLGPPNQGSELVDSFVKIPGYRQLNGFAGQQLGTTDNSVPNNLGAVNFELGIIAGSQSINPILSLLLPGDDDGKVTVERTKVDGMNDHLTLPTTHTFMMRNTEVIEQVIAFLHNGAFNSPANEN